MAYLRDIQLLRSEEVYSSLQAVKNAISANKNELLDGSPIIGRYYYGSGANRVIKSVIGIAHANVNGETDVTFFENANDIADAIAELQSELDTTQSSVGLNDNGTHIDQGGKWTSGKTTVEAEIRALEAVLEALDVNSKANDNQVVVDVTQSDGKINADLKKIVDIKLSGYTAPTTTNADNTDSSVKVAYTDTLGEATAKLQKQINSMDKAASAVNGQVVTTVSEADGQVTETKANVKDLQLGGYAKDTTLTGAIASTDTVNTALSKIENAVTANKIANQDGSIKVTDGNSSTATDINVVIKSGEHVIKKDGGNGLYTNFKISATTLSSDDVKEEFVLVATDGTELGPHIKIYKDSSIQNIFIGHVDDTLQGADADKVSTSSTVVSGSGNDALVYVYQLSNGKYKLVAIDIESFLKENEFLDGLEVVNDTRTGENGKVVKVKIDNSADTVVLSYNTNGTSATTGHVMSVSSNGVKASNIQTAINAAIGKSTTKIATSYSASTSAIDIDKHIILTSAQNSDGSTTYTLTNTDIASKVKLDNEVKRASSAETALDSVLGSTKSPSDESRTWIKSNTHYVGTATTVLSDVTKLDSELYALSSKTVTNFTSTNNSISALTSSTSNGTVNADLMTNASKISGLTAVASSDEGAAKVSGVSATDSVQTGIKNIYDSLKSEIAARKAAMLGRTISGSSAVKVTEAPNADGFGTKVELVLDGETQGVGDEKYGVDNALTINNDKGLFLSTTWECGTF